MLKSFTQIIGKAREFGQTTISVAVAQDRDVLLAVKAAQEAGVAEAILVGDAGEIKPMAKEIGLIDGFSIMHELDLKQAAKTAVALVRSGQAKILMKGLINTGDFLKAVLSSEGGIRSGRLLSHLTCYEVPGNPKIIFYTDGGVNIAPRLEEKKDILVNALTALKALGISQPNVAVLAANEQVNAKMPATVDARALANLYGSDDSFNGIVEGPISMDVALNPEAAGHKGIISNISGNVDLFMVPNIEAGNLLSKALIYYAGFKIAGVVLGATNPIIMVSRADTAESKLSSIALASLLANSVKRRN
ncbi:MAG: Phosphate butyryltransferase [Firmicutes bacterium]|nr:Phosphate butyryltransferase [Bacillota bacterium]